MPIGIQAGLLILLVMLPPSLLSGWLAATRPAIPHWLLFLAAYLLTWIAWVVFVLAMWSTFSPGNMSEGWVGGMAGWFAALAPWFAALAPIFFGFHYLVYRIRRKRVAALVAARARDDERRRLQSQPRRTGG